MDNGYSECVNEEHFLQRLYFETGYEASIQELNIPSDIVFYQNGVTYYLTFGYAMGFPYVSTELSNREIISCDGETCKVKYTAHSSIWNEQGIGDDFFYDNGFMDILFLH